MPFHGINMESYSIGVTNWPCGGIGRRKGEPIKG